MKPRIVIDTNVRVSAFRSRRRASWKLVNLLRDEVPPFSLHLPVPLAFEYEETFRQQHLQMGLAQAQVGVLLDAICEVGAHHDIHYLWRGFSRDPDDAQVLELAVKAACDAIVTYNKCDFAEAPSFGVEVLTAHEFLQRLER